MMIFTGIIDGMDHFYYLVLGLGDVHSFNEGEVFPIVEPVDVEEDCVAGKGG